MTEPAVPPTAPTQLMRLCEALRVCNDQLGKYSDHEGDENGSTWHFWQMGKSRFDMYAARAIADHKAAIGVWKELRALNDNSR